MKLFILLAVLTAAAQINASEQIIPGQTKGVILPGQTQNLLSQLENLQSMLMIPSGPAVQNVDPKTGIIPDNQYEIDLKKSFQPYVDAVKNAAPILKGILDMINNAQNTAIPSSAIATPSGTSSSSQSTSAKAGGSTPTGSASTGGSATSGASK